jgi:hypothetical protein
MAPHLASVSTAVWTRRLSRMARRMCDSAAVLGGPIKTRLAVVTSLYNNAECSLL